MFRTVRTFLLAAPAVFVVTLTAFLLAHPRAADTFSPYPFLVDALGQAVTKRPVARFVIITTAFFLLPYLVTGVLLFLADVGVGAAAPIWRRSGGAAEASLPLESRAGFVASAAVLALWTGVSLHRVAHGGELPGGVNLAPVFVVLASFVTLGLALVVAGLLAIPRALLGRFASRAT